MPSRHASQASGPAPDPHSADGRQNGTAAAPVAQRPWSLVTDSEALEEVLRELRSIEVIGIDCETTGLDPLGDHLRLIQLATPNKVYLVDCARVAPQTLAPLFRAGPRFVGHNLKFDLGFLQAVGLPVPGGDRLFDTMLAAQIVDAGSEEGLLKNCGLAVIANRLLGITLSKTEQRSDWSGPLSDARLTYAAADAAVLLPLMERLIEVLSQTGLTEVMNLEMGALPAIAWLEQSGAPFDTDRWMEISNGAVAKQIELEQALTAEVGGLPSTGAVLSRHCGFSRSGGTTGSQERLRRP